jgi:hypothetical protein
VTPITTETGRPIPEPGIRAQLFRIRYDLTAAQAKLTDVFAQIDRLGIDTEPRRQSFVNGPVLADTCPDCGVGGNMHTHDCQAAHLEVARAHIPSQEES